MSTTMKKIVPLLLSFCLFTQVVAQSNIKFQTIDRKAAFFDNPPIVRKNSEKVETGQPVISITCYSKGKNVYSKRICHEIDYLFSSEYLNLIEELKLLNQRCQAAEN